MFSTDLYLNKITKKKSKKEKFDNYIFGVIFGISLLFVALFGLITDQNIYNDKIYIGLLILSIIDFFLLIFLPSKIKYLKAPFSFIGKIISRVILSVLILIVYIVWFIPASFIYKSKKINTNTTFEDKQKVIIKTNNSNLFSQIKSILSYFMCIDNFYLIPVIIIFIIIGLILFFAQSSAITPLIYPLI